MSSEDKEREVNTFHLVLCPECDKQLDYTVDAQITQHYEILSNGNQ